jgi:hypothetical protein
MIIKILAEVFRILRVIRNVVVHSSSQLSINDSYLKASATTATGEEIKIRLEGLKGLYTAVLLLIEVFKNQNSNCSEYVKWLLGYYLRFSIDSIEEFKDQFGNKNTLGNFLPNDRILNNIHRQIVFNNPFSKVNGEICLNNPYRPPELERNIYKCDFIIKYNDDVSLIPEEYFEHNDYKIPISELNRWKFDSILENITNVKPK